MKNGDRGRRERHGRAAAPTRPRAIAGEQQVAAMSAGKIFLAIKDRPLNWDELKLIYQSVYPRANLTDADKRLQQGQVMSKEEVGTQLGPDMQATYDFLVGVNFPYAGTRPHNRYADLPRHLWDTTYRMQLMGLPLEQRQLALTHSLPVHMARGLAEAKSFIALIRENVGTGVADGLEHMANWDAVLVDHLRYKVEKIGSNGDSDSIANLKKRLERISTEKERERVVKTLEDVVKLAIGSSKRLVPSELADSPIYPEARARLHAAYIRSLRGDYKLFVVKSLCLIDRLRTADGAAQVEKVTRETADFLPRIDSVLKQPQVFGIYDNVLRFAAAALETEFITELYQMAAYAGSKSDTSFKYFANLLEERLAKAMKLYGGTARAMGCKPVPPAGIRYQPSSPSAQS